MRRLPRLLAALKFVALVALAACGRTNPPIDLQNVLQAPAGRQNASQKYLYLGLNTGSGPTLLVYPLHGSKPLREIVDSWRVVDIAVDRRGDVYTADNNPTGGEITAYTSGGRSLLFSMYAGGVNCMTFDAVGDLYACQDEFIAEYAPRSAKRIGPARAAVNVWDLALDRAGNVYAAQLTGKGSESSGAVKVFHPHAQHPFRVLHRGISNPTALAVDTSANLYVANCPACWSEDGTGSIAEYAPGSSTPLRVLKKGVDSPDALAVGPNNELFVANNPHDLQKHGAWISIYGTSGESPVHRISKGIDLISAIALDAKGNLYVVCGCNHKAEVAVFNQHFALTREITDGVVNPQSIAIGP